MVTPTSRSNSASRCATLASVNRTSWSSSAPRGDIAPVLIASARPLHDAVKGQNAFSMISGTLASFSRNDETHRLEPGCGGDAACRSQRFRTHDPLRHWARWAARLQAPGDVRVLPIAWLGRDSFHPTRFLAQRRHASGRRGGVCQTWQNSDGSRSFALRPDLKARWRDGSTEQGIADGL